MILFFVSFKIETTNPEKLKADERYINENPVSNVSLVLFDLTQPGLPFSQLIPFENAKN